MKHHKSTMQFIDQQSPERLDDSKVVNSGSPNKVELMKAGEFRERLKKKLSLKDKYNTISANHEYCVKTRKVPDDFKDKLPEIQTRPISNMKKIKLKPKELHALTFATSFHKSS